MSQKRQPLTVLARRASGEAIFRTKQQLFAHEGCFSRHKVLEGLRLRWRDRSDGKRYMLSTIIQIQAAGVLQAKTSYIV